MRGSTYDALLVSGLGKENPPNIWSAHRLDQCNANLLAPAENPLIDAFLQIITHSGHRKPRVLHVSTCAVH